MRFGIRTVVVLAVVGGLAAACSGSAVTSAPAPTPTPTPLSTPTPIKSPTFPLPSSVKLNRICTQVAVNDSLSSPKAREVVSRVLTGMGLEAVGATDPCDGTLSLSIQVAPVSGQYRVNGTSSFATCYTDTSGAATVEFSLPGLPATKWTENRTMGDSGPNIVACPDAANAWNYDESWAEMALDGLKDVWGIAPVFKAVELYGGDRTGFHGDVVDAAAVVTVHSAPQLSAEEARTGLSVLVPAMQIASDALSDKVCYALIALAAGQGPESGCNSADDWLQWWSQQKPDAPLATLQLPSTAKDLEALLPNEYGGTKLTKMSLSGAKAAGQMAVGQSEETTKVLASIGKSFADFSIASAGSQVEDVVFLAVRVAGADASAMKRVFVAAVQQPGDELQQMSLGGRDIFKNASINSQGGSYFYIRGDTAFGVSAPDDATAAKALVLLP